MAKLQTLILNNDLADDSYVRINTGSMTVLNGELWAVSAISASYATTASYAMSSSWAIYSIYSLSASLAQQAISSSYADTSSWAINAITASYAETSSWSIRAISSSYAETSSWAINAITASHALTVPSSSISYSHIQNVNANKLLGRSNSVNGIVEELTIGSGLILNNKILNSTSPLILFNNRTISGTTYWNKASASGYTHIMLTNTTQNSATLYFNGSDYTDNERIVFMGNPTNTSSIQIIDYIPNTVVYPFFESNLGNNASITMIRSSSQWIIFNSGQVYRTALTQKKAINYTLLPSNFIKTGSSNYSVSIGTISGSNNITLGSSTVNNGNKNVMLNSIVTNGNNNFMLNSIVTNGNDNFLIDTHLTGSGNFIGLTGINRFDDNIISSNFNIIGDNNFLVGQNLKIYRDNSNEFEGGKFQFATNIGTDNSISRGSIIIGKENLLKTDQNGTQSGNNIILGKYNIQSGSTAIVLGEHNTIEGSKQILIGEFNKSKDSDAIMIGKSNLAFNQSIAIGRLNETGPSSYGIGSSVILKERSFGIGSLIEGKYNGQFLFGANLTGKHLSEYSYGLINKQLSPAFAEYSGLNFAHRRVTWVGSTSNTTPKELFLNGHSPNNSTDNTTRLKIDETTLLNINGTTLVYGKVNNDGWARIKYEYIAYRQGSNDLILKFVTGSTEKSGSIGTPIFNLTTGSGATKNYIIASATSSFNSTYNWAVTAELLDFENGG